MAAITAKYLGDIRVEASHEASGATLITDSPVDIGGKGRSFSPTDLCAASLGMCAMSMMAVYGKNHEIDVEGMGMEINKIMSQDAPRRIARIEITFTMPDRGYTEKQKLSLERAAKSCPVHNSLHPDTEQVFLFQWAK